MKTDMFYIVINMFGIVAGAMNAFKAIRNDDNTMLIISNILLVVNAALAIYFILEAIRAIVREELKKNYEQKS